MKIALDHIAVLGETLVEAAAHAEAALGSALTGGGRHARFGTYNRLHGLADGLYLEAIAVDPSAPAPADKRWFGLSDFAGPARLGMWICNVDDLDAALAVFPEAGRVVDLERDNLRWRMAVPETGITPFGGLFPALIEWQVPVPPGKTLSTANFRLTTLEVVHPDAAKMQAGLVPHLDDARIAYVTEPVPGLRAHIDTPSGSRILQ